MRKIVLALAAYLVPVIAFAQTPRTFAELVYMIISYINPIASILAAAAMLIFFYGIVLYVFKSADEESHERGRQLILWGVVALFVLFSVWSLAGILVNTFFGGAPTTYTGGAIWGGGGTYYSPTGTYTNDPSQRTLPLPGGWSY